MECAQRAIKDIAFDTRLNTQWGADGAACTGVGWGVDLVESVVTDGLMEVARVGKYSAPV